MTQPVMNSRHKNNQRAWRRGMMHSDLAHLRADLKAAEVLAAALAREIDEAYDAGLIALRGGMRTLPQKGSPSDSTGNSITSYEYQRFQSVGIYVAGRINRATKAASSMRSAITEASAAIHNAWLDTDPDIGPDRRRERAEAKQAAAELERVSSVAP